MKIYREFLRYVIPSMLAFALSGIYAIADGFFVGNAMGDAALAAINVAYPMTALLQAVGTGIGMGGAIEYSIGRGNGDAARSREFFGVSLAALVGSGILLTLVLLGISPALLALFGASGEIYDFAREYILYIAYGAIFQILGTGLVPFIRNMGGSITAMTAMIAGFVTNIVLDYLFVWVYPWGMTGAAAATVIGQGMTFLVCLLFLAVKKEKPVIPAGRRGLVTLKRICQIGLSPFGLTYSPNITLILINKSAAVFGGTEAVTCYAPISYISCIIILLLQGISDGCQPLLSLLYGEGKRKETLQVRRLAYWFALGVGLVCMAVVFFTREKSAFLFGASASVTETVAQILPLFLWGYLFICISRVTIAYFYATTKNLYAYLVIYGEVVFLAVFLMILPWRLGVNGTWMAVPLSQIMAALLSLVLIWREARLHKKITSGKRRDLHR